MKLYLLLLTGILLSVHTFSQCDPPVINNWNVENDTTITIDFEASSGASEYVVKFISLYVDNVGSPSSADWVVSYNGVVDGDQNSITHNPKYFDFMGFSPSDGISKYYYKVQLGTICGSDTIYANDLYMSSNSLLNNGAMTCPDNFFMPFQFLADGVGFSYQVDFEIESEDVPVQIDELFVLLDIGHTYNGDLSIELVSPSGTSVSLLDYAGNSLGGSKGFSVLFQDGADTNLVAIDGSVRGIYGPSESFSAFMDEPVAGIWSVVITDNIAIDHGFLFGICLNINSSPCISGFEGDLYYDMNSNGVNDPEEDIMPYGLLSTNNDALIVSQTNGFYACSDTGEVSFALENVPLYYTSVPESYTIDLEEGDYLEGFVFALQPTPDIVDLQVDLYATSPDRPGFESMYYVNYNNIGTECVYDVLVNFEVDPSVDIINVDGGENPVINGSMVFMTIDTLCPNESGLLEILVSVNENTSIGDTLIYSTNITPLSGDENESNNMDTLESIVVGSFDPNDITVDNSVIGEGFIADEKYLEYVIRFQNSGNFYAENVEVRNTIEEDLQLNTIEILNASHPMEVSIEGNELVFSFNDIFLPAEETDEAGSHGYLRYRIKPVSDFTVNEVIENNAEIYFDFNEPIYTNTATTILDVVGIDEMRNEAVALYPNPSDGNFYLVNSENIFKSYSIKNMLGETLKVGIIVDNSIPTDRLNSGIFVIEFLDAKGAVVGRSSVVKK